MKDSDIRIFLAGDVMTGRGIDQILPHSAPPQLYESFVTDAREYVFLAEEANGKISYPVAENYIWGDALTVWQNFQPNLKIANLETAITLSDTYWPEKGINYRMHPKNVNTLTSAGFDICTLANNHILDWNYPGLEETITTLKDANIQFAGVGENIAQAMKPAVFNLPFAKRVLTFSCGSPSSGVSPSWAATVSRPGLYYLSDFSSSSIESVLKNISGYKQPGDLVIFSIHWGSNWVYDIPQAFRDFAHRLIESGEIDVIFGHSSHHPLAIEIYQDKPILYGTGDFINDYEGIGGHEQFRPDLSIMYFLDFEAATLRFKEITLVPLQIKNFRLHLANQNDCRFIQDRINGSTLFGAQFVLHEQKLIYILSK